MERRCQEVINRCWGLNESNPILSIHDVGAGGLSNAIPEILHDSGRGGDIQLRSIPNANPGMSPLEIWCNEAQERYIVALNEEDLDLFAAICGRERCPMAVVGVATAAEHLRVYDDVFDRYVIDLPMNVIFGKPPKMFREAAQHPRASSPFATTTIDLDDALRRVLSFPSVADKRFLITIGDRNVGGLAARDQMVGPWQTPVADCAVTASGFGCFTGEAMALGERAPVALLNAPASGRLAIGEAITNLAAARIMRLSDLVLSANWMAAAGHPGEDVRLYETVEAVAMELCPALGIAIPVGKDSMSMKAQWRDHDTETAVTSPLSLVITAFAPVVDIRQTLTPELKLDEPDTCLVFVDLGASRQRLGGSILAQCYGAMGDLTADLESPEILRDFFGAIQLLNESGYMLAYHDRSDGGLITTLCEMAFCARSGLDIEISALGVDPISALFCEELGAFLQSYSNHREAVLSLLRASESLVDGVHVIGQPTPGRRIKVQHQAHEVLDLALVDLLEAWSENSFHMQRVRDNPDCAEQEFSAIVDPDDPGLHVNFSPNSSGSPQSPSVITARPRIAVLREQGVNGHVEMAAAFDRAGFDAVDVHMSDLIDRGVALEQFNGLVACGGFSYGDVLGAGGGWAKSILFNSQARDAFEKFFNRNTSFTLGVCNGCQMLSHLQELIPGAHRWPTFLPNLSEQFEARLVMAEVLESPSILLSGMVGSRAPIVVAHGEGRVQTEATAETFNSCLRFVDNHGAATERYPYNPNGSTEGITGLTTDDGRVTIMMPHPERVFLRSQFSWIEPSWTDEEGPWMKVFHNARQWLG